MHYFTKEWYELETGAHLGLEEDKQAESFSEEYFQELYKQKLMELLEEVQIIQEEIALKHETIKEGHIKYGLFDKEKISENFHQSFLDNQNHIKNALPEEILKKIADIRVFVLHKATRQVIECVTQFCQANIDSMLKTVEDYRKYYKEVSKNLDKGVLEGINCHDCTVVDMEAAENTLTILFDNAGSFTNVTKMSLKNYEILKQDASLQNSLWVNEEIYKTNGKYELHVMFRNKNNGLIEFIVTAEHISFEYIN